MLEHGADRGLPGLRLGGGAIVPEEYAKLKLSSVQDTWMVRVCMIFRLKIRMPSLSCSDGGDRIKGLRAIGVRWVLSR